MPRRVLRKAAEMSQAGLEYLMTYGWALLLIVTIVGVLFTVIGAPSGYACSGLGAILCNAMNNNNSDLYLTMQNSRPFDIKINPFTGLSFDGRTGYAMIVYGGTEYFLDDVTIKKGDTFQVKGIGFNKASELKLTYTEVPTGYTKTETISLITPTKVVCNDPSVECPAECTACSYVFTATGVTPTSNPTITFPTNSTPGNATGTVLFFYVIGVLPSSQANAILNGITTIASGYNVINGWNKMNISTSFSIMTGSSTDIMVDKSGGSYNVLSDVGPPAHTPIAIITIQ